MENNEVIEETVQGIPEERSEVSPAPISVEEGFRKAQQNEEDSKKQKRLLNLQKAREARALNQANIWELEVLRAQLGGRQAGPKTVVQEAPAKVQVEEINYGFIIDQLIKRMSSMKVTSAPKKQVQAPRTAAASASTNRYFVNV